MYHNIDNLGNQESTQSTHNSSSVACHQYISETLDYDIVMQKSQNFNSSVQIQQANLMTFELKSLPTSVSHEEKMMKMKELNKYRLKKSKLKAIMQQDSIQKKLKIEYNDNNRTCKYKSIAIKTPFVLQSKNSSKKHCQSYLENFSLSEIKLDLKSLDNNIDCTDQNEQIQHYQSQSNISLNQSNQTKIFLNTQNYYCGISNCPFVTSSKSTLLSHKRNIHSNKSFKCSQCDFVTKNKVCLLQHQRNMHSQVLLECPYKISGNCHFQAKNNGVLQAHISKVHLQQKEEIYECGYQGCQFKTKSLRSCYSHKVNVHSTETYHCEYENCNFKSKSKKSYQHHKANVHSTKTFKCPEPGCNFTAKNKVIINNHRKNIHEQCVTFCQISGCYFKSKNQRSLQNHLRNKHGIKSQKAQQEVLSKFIRNNDNLLNIQQQYDKIVNVDKNGVNIVQIQQIHQQ